jgi:hypothetical protein
MNKVAIGIFTVSVVIGFGAVANANGCDPEPGLFIDGRDGNLNAGDVLFSYQSRMEKDSPFAHRFVWCVKASADNQNISEFHWGDGQNEKKYLNTLIEPGRNGFADTTDDSKKIVGTRTIKFRKKNKPDWGSINSDTISSQKFGLVSDRPSILLAQFSTSSSDQNWANLNQALNQYKGEDGLIQIEKLSANKSLLLETLKANQRMEAGGSFSVTLPANLRTADLIQKNEYEKFNSDDFVVVRTKLSSEIVYNDGKPKIYYFIGLQPETENDFKRLVSLLDDKLVRFKIGAAEPIIQGKLLPTELTPFSFGSLKGAPIAQLELDGRAVSLAPVRVDISFGENAPVSSFESKLFVPN